MYVPLSFVQGMATKKGGEGGGVAGTTWGIFTAHLYYQKIEIYSNRTVTLIQQSKMYFTLFVLSL